MHSLSRTVVPSFGRPLPPASRPPVFDMETEHFGELEWCPDCQSPPSSDFAHLKYCKTHMPTTGGSIDRVVDTSQYLSGGGEAGDVNNRLWCDLLHRRKEHTHEPAS